MQIPSPSWKECLFQFLSSTDEDKVIGEWVAHRLSTHMGSMGQRRIYWIDMGSGTGAKVSHALESIGEHVARVEFVDPWIDIGPWITNSIQSAKKEGVSARWIPFDLNYAMRIFRETDRSHQSTDLHEIGMISSFHVCYDRDSFAQLCDEIEKQEHQFVAHAVESDDSMLAVLRAKIGRELGIVVPAAHVLSQKYMRDCGYDSVTAKIKKSIWIPSPRSAGEVPDWLVSLVLGLEVQISELERSAFDTIRRLIFDELLDGRGNHHVSNDVCTFAWRRR